jgi:hypothetical protein
MNLLKQRRRWINGTIAGISTLLPLSLIASLSLGVVQKTWFDLESFQYFFLAKDCIVVVFLYSRYDSFSLCSLS